MRLLSDVFMWWAALGLVTWAFIIAAALLVLARLCVLHRVTSPPAGSSERVSVIVPACNEVKTLEASVRSLLASSYPNLEIVLVNDRSSDATGAVADRLARRDPRVKVVHIQSLPRGWLGKVYALHRGASRATGAWLLFTDADVHFARPSIERATTTALEHRVDHLAVYPAMRELPFVVETIASALGVALLLLTGALRKNAPVGVGAFNLVRRRVWDRSEGFQYLKMEVADDMGVGMVIRKAGGRSMCASGAGLVTIRWYDDLDDMFAGMEKNLFAISARYSVARWLAIVVGVALVMLAPFVALATGQAMLVAAALTVLVGATLASVVGWRTLGGRLAPWLFAPLAPLAMAVMLLRSGVMCLRRGGVLWRGTLYPLEVLRAEQRVRLL